ncbi:hypothetical protein [Dyadobacter frigoris]|uniref:Uncharacterized protein n=1 Tax=Dyadobacter frigoris TaxID=2576211 RepID=A0A4U6D8T8_9BACT|nr:hypothetical protein [Dyadobacter frigoris]TKT92771.1 hypothetical protein FDK13_08180 [Dyadobacter frigoris]
MTESDFGHTIIKFGYILLAARGVILFAFLVRCSGKPVSRLLKPLFYWSIFAFVIALIEVSFISLVNSFPDFFVPYLDRFDIHDTFFTSPFYYLNEILFLGIFFSQIYGERAGKIILITSISLFALEILNSLFWEGYKDAQKIGSFSDSVFIIILSLLFFQRHFISKIKNPLSNDALNLVVWGFFSISTFSILILFFSDRLFDDFPTLFYQISIGRMIIETMGLMLIAYGVSIFKSSSKINP